MIALLSPKYVVFALIAMSAVATSALAQDASTPAMTLLVDETQAARRIAFVHEEIRVRPGALALAYPRWIPGEHGPTGPIQQFAALRIHSGNVTLPWTRDPEDIYTIHVERAGRRRSNHRRLRYVAGKHDLRSSTLAGVEYGRAVPARHRQARS